MRDTYSRPMLLQGTLCLGCQVVYVVMQTNYLYYYIKSRSEDELSEDELPGDCRRLADKI